MITVAIGSQFRVRPRDCIELVAREAASALRCLEAQRELTIRERDLVGALVRLQEEAGRGPADFDPAGSHPPRLAALSDEVNRLCGASASLLDLLGEPPQKFPSWALTPFAITSEHCVLWVIGHVLAWLEQIIDLSDGVEASRKRRYMELHCLQFELNRVVFLARGECPLNALAAAGRSATSIFAEIDRLLGAETDQIFNDRARIAAARKIH